MVGVVVAVVLVGVVDWDVVAVVVAEVEVAVVVTVDVSDVV